MLRSSMASLVGPNTSRILGADWTSPSIVGDIRPETNTRVNGGDDFQALGTIEATPPQAQSPGLMHSGRQRAGREREKEEP